MFNEPQSSAVPSPGTPAGGPRGADIARAALESARAGRRKSAGKQGKQTVPRRRRGWSGARPDDRDPQPLGRLASRLVADRGWVDRVSAGVVFARWTQLVGAEIAEHAQPVSLKDGELLVRASSTAWATQLRLLQRQLIARITAGVGPGVVKALRVQGPAAPKWVHGPRHVRGRGPRDTYG
ncbi:MAG TPA: DciA family protein [Pseudonocardiaceae bacterium]|nr:DciA family protein [Pseudonocardiaceae bacterium]